MAGPEALGDVENQWSRWYQQVLEKFHQSQGLTLQSLGDQAISDKLKNVSFGSSPMEHGFADPNMPVFNPYTPDEYNPGRSAHVHGSQTAVEDEYNRKLDEKQQMMEAAQPDQYTQGRIQHLMNIFNGTDNNPHRQMTGENAPQPQQQQQQQQPQGNWIPSQPVRQSPYRLAMAPLNPSGNPQLGSLQDDYMNTHFANMMAQGYMPQQQQQQQDGQQDDTQYG